MKTRNKILTIVAIITLLLVLISALSSAWLAMGVIKFAFVVFASVTIGYVWGRLSKK